MPGWSEFYCGAGRNQIKEGTNMTQENHNLCNRVPETSRCNRRKKKNECPAASVGKNCISPNAGKLIRRAGLPTGVISSSYQGLSLRV